jgi:hypothetical protein
MEEENKKYKHKTPIHDHYRSLLIDIELNEDEDEDDIVLTVHENASVQCIIWGALYLEALVNFYCHDLIFEAVKDNELAASLIWNLTKYSSLPQKIDFLLDYRELPKSHRKENIKPINEIFDIRNRLVHFKEPYFESEENESSQFAYNIEGEKVILKKNKVFSPIELRLQQKKVIDWKQQVLDSGDWLTVCATREIPLELYEEYYSKDKLDELEAKYGSDLSLKMIISPREAQKQAMESGEIDSLIDSLMKRYNRPITIYRTVKYTAEDILFAMLSWEESHPDKKEYLLKKETPQPFLDKYEEWKKEHDK